MLGPTIRTFRIALGLACLVVVLCGSARAQAGDDATTAPPTPPIAQGSTDVPYPAGARGDATVVVEIVVETDGSVSSATVVEGDPPFAEPARLGAMTWRFAPARRGTQAVRVKTRARVVFRQEEVEVDAGIAPVAASGSTLDGGAPPPAPVVEDVTVHGLRHEIVQTTMSAEDVREMPGAFGDPFRAVEALPSVVPVLSGLGYFYIRGAPPNDNGYFLDGVRVPQLFHVGLGPGVIHPGLVESVEVYPGAAPASYGRYIGGIIAGQTREPATKFHGEASLRLVDAGALLESPFADGRGTALAAARYGYPGPVVGLFSDIDLGYWDYQARATWRADERDTLGIFAFGSHDYLAHTEAHGMRIEDFSLDFHRVDVRLDRAIADGRMRVAATLGYDAQGGTGLDANLAPPKLIDESAAVRFEVERQVRPELRVRGGADARIDGYDFEQSPSRDANEVVLPSSVDPPPTNVTAGAFADVIWRVTRRVEIVPGVRVDAYSSTQGGSTTTIPAIDPRISTRVGLARSVAWISSVGLAHQYPALRVGGIMGIFVNGTGFPPGRHRLQQAMQGSQGVEIALPADLTLTATGFLSGWSGMTDLTPACIQLAPAVQPAAGPNQPPPPPQYACPSGDPVHGHAYGLEVLLRRPLSKRLGVWLSYTLSRSERDTHFLTATGGDVLANVPSDFDHTHVLNAVAAYDLGRRWRAGGRFVFYSGAPYSALSGNVPVPPYNSLRDPPFFRVDVRLEKRWPLGRDGSIAFVLEGQNVTLSKQPTSLGEDCMGEGRPGTSYTTTCKRAELGPITLPSIGVEAFF